jgi:GDP-D-mannose dehydratase
MKTPLITGIAEQDGSNLAEFLLEKGCRGAQGLSGLGE